MVCTLHKAIFCNQLCIILQPILVGTSKSVPVGAFWHFSTLICVTFMFYCCQCWTKPSSLMLCLKSWKLLSKGTPGFMRKTDFGEPFAKKYFRIITNCKGEMLPLVSVCVKHRAFDFHVNTWMHLCAPVFQTHYLPQSLPQHMCFLALTLVWLLARRTAFQPEHCFEWCYSAKVIMITCKP